MKQITVTLATLIFLTALVSCSKDKNNATAGADITGTYKFISLQAKTNSTVESVSGSYITKTVTTSDYTSLNNAGTFKIDAGKFVMSNFSYSINSTAISTVYENGSVFDKFTFPLQVAIPATNGTSAYKRISADSLYFDSGSMFIGGSASTPEPGGAKIKYENGKLTLYGNAVKAAITKNQDETVTNMVSAVSVIVLQKQ